MKMELEGEELWTRFIIRFILIGSLLYLVTKLSIFTLAFHSPY